MSFFSKLISVAAPIIGGIFGGPVGASIGGAIGGAVGGGGWKGAAKGAILGGAGAALGAGAIGGLGGGAGALASGGAATFGVVDQGIADYLAAGGGDALGAGLGAAGGSFGVVDPQLAGYLQAGGGSPAVNTLGAATDMANQWQAGQGLGTGAGGSSVIPSGGAGASSNPIMNFLHSTFSGPSLLKSAMTNGLKYGMPVMQILGGLQAEEQARRLQQQMQLPNPGDITGIPGYQAGLETVQRSMAAQGYQGSGNMMAALSKYGGDFYNQYVGQRVGSARAQGDAILGRMSGMGLAAGGIKNLAGAF